MKKKKIYKASLEVAILTSIFGGLFRIMHWPGASILLMISFGVALIFILIALVRIYEDSNKSVTEKLLWLIGFIGLPWIVGMLYYFNDLRKT